MFNGTKDITALVNDESVVKIHPFAHVDSRASMWAFFYLSMQLINLVLIEAGRWAMLLSAMAIEALG